jgi:hypothetical protein
MYVAIKWLVEKVKNITQSTPQEGCQRHHPPDPHDTVEVINGYKFIHERKSYHDFEYNLALS